MSLPAGSVLDAILQTTNPQVDLGETTKKQSDKTLSALPTVVRVISDEKAVGSSKNYKNTEKRDQTADSEVDDPDVDTAQFSGDLATLHKKIDQLTHIVSSLAPVVHELKTAYDDANKENYSSSDAGEAEGDDEIVEQPVAKKAKVDEPSISTPRVVDSLVCEVTESEKTCKALPEKLSSVIDNILASGLNEQVLEKRKEAIRRPENCKLLTVTKVNAEIWDVAGKNTCSMDARLQRMQDTLIKGLIPTAQLAGALGEVIDQVPASAMPSNESMWESLSNSVLLIAAANHELNMCRRDMFKPELDNNYKAICTRKVSVGSELFGDDLTDRLNTVTASNKATRQLTGQKRKNSSNTDSRRNSSLTSRTHFLSHNRGRSRWGGPSRRTNQNYVADNRRYNPATYTTKGNKSAKQK